MMQRNEGGEHLWQLQAWLSLREYYSIDSYIWPAVSVTLRDTTVLSRWTSCHGQYLAIKYYHKLLLLRITT